MTSQYSRGIKNELDGSQKKRLLCCLLRPHNIHITFFFFSLPFCSQKIVKREPNFRSPLSFTLSLGRRLLNPSMTAERISSLLRKKPFQAGGLCVLLLKHKRKKSPEAKITRYGMLTVRKEKKDENSISLSVHKFEPLALPTEILFY